MFATRDQTRYPRRRTTRRAAIYITILLSSVLVAVVGISGLALLRLQLRETETAFDTCQARLNAQAGIDRLLQVIADEPDWRTARSAGRWFNDQKLPRGAVSVDIADPLDSDLSDNACDPAVVTAYGTVGTAVHGLQVTLEADAAAEDAFAEALLGLGPLAYWRLGESGGTDAIDSANGYDGSYFNGVTLGSTALFSCDTSATLDGLDDMIIVDHDDDFLLDDGTVHLWFKADDPIATGALFSKDALHHETGGHFAIILASGVVACRLQSTENDYFVASSAAIFDQDWHHLVVTFGSDGLQLFLDGAEVDRDGYTGGWGETSGEGDSMSELEEEGGDIGNYEPIGIGVGLQSSDPGEVTPWETPFAGQLDDVALFDYQLSAEEIAELYAIGDAGLPHTMTPVSGAWQRVLAP